MKKFATAIAVGSLALAACGSSNNSGGSGDKQTIIDSILDDPEIPDEVDEGCVKDKVNDLSDSDAELIADNLDSADMPEGLSEDGQGLIVGMLDCIDFSDLDFSDLEE